MVTDLWCTVEYEDDSVQIVPRCWIVAEKCYWPSNNTFKTNKKYLKAVKNCISPSEDWPLYDAKILGTYGTIIYFILPLLSINICVIYNI